MNKWDKEYGTSFYDEVIFLRKKEPAIHGCAVIMMDFKYGNIERQENYGLLWRKCIRTKNMNVRFGII